ncbi:MAG: hypothetical protein ACE5HI_16355, partial [bacterium]
RIQLEVPFFYSHSSRSAGLTDAIFDKRITHIRIYAAEGDSNHSKNNYFMIFEAPVDVEFLKPTSTASGLWIYDGTNNIHHFNFNVDLSTSIWNGTTTKDITGNNKHILGKSTRWDFNQGHQSVKVDVNFKFKTTPAPGEQHYKAPIFSDDKRNAFLSFSIESNGEGVPADDVYPQENFINLSQKGVDEITGLASTGGFLIVLTKNKVFRYSIDQQLLEFPVERGCISPNSVREIDDIIYFAGVDDVYAFNGATMRRLMFDKILDQWEALTVTQKENARAGYHKLSNTYWIYAGSTLFIYEIDFNAWRTKEGSRIPTWFSEGVDGELFYTDGIAIYEEDSATWTENINIDWRSRVIDLSKNNGRIIPIKGIFNELIMRYKSDNNITVELWSPSYSNVYPIKTIPFIPQSNMKTAPARELSFEASDLEIRIKDVNQGNQPQVEIDYLLMNFFEVSE